MTIEDNNNFDDNQFEEFQEPYEEEPGIGEENGSNGNRRFLLIAGIIGGVFVLLIIGLVIFVLLNRGRTAAQLQEEAARINAENTAIAQQATEIAGQEIMRLTEKAIMPPTWTPTFVLAQPTNTPPAPATVVVELSSAERTATVAAFLTQVAGGTPTPEGTAAGPIATTTALPDTGFMDDVGLPGLLGLAAALILVVFIVRRLRLSTNT